MSVDPSVPPHHKVPSGELRPAIGLGTFGSDQAPITKVVTVGEILVEIMAQERGFGFREPLRLLGPYPSGAPAIFIDQVAKLGQPAGIVSCVGDDDFGWLNRQRLSDDGADVSAVEVCPGLATGSAFVRYRHDGGRDFVYNVAHSALGQLRLTAAAAALLAQAGHLHVSGPSLFSAEVITMILDAADELRARGGTVSFDPNARKEVLGNPELKAALSAMLGRCDMFLPSGDELVLLTEAATPEAALVELFERGVKAVVLKQGAAGATYHDAQGSCAAPGYPVAEVDPTGAGDCFAATFVTCILQGYPVPEALAYANAAGARAVTVAGPMEGTSSFAQLDALRRSAPLTSPASPAIPARPAHGPRSFVAFMAAHHPGAGVVQAGITSVCSAHPLVVEAAMRQAAADGTAVLIEATCNQVNHQGGYTGLTPGQFRDQVLAIATLAGLASQRVVLGGDHLGPNPWRHLPAEVAMAEAEKMVAAYVAAGYQKIHLDTSMGCAGEPVALADELTAARAARLAAVALAAAPDPGALSFVIGTEVPVPGGAREEIAELEVTKPEAVLATVEAHRAAFAEAKAAAAFGAVVAVVVQPGVEFDEANVVVYRPERAVALSAALAELPGLVFEAHSTDYQPPARLADLVADGFAILKVGPALTFALREALYGLDHIAGALHPAWAETSLMAAVEAEMLARPGYWEPYYHGSANEQRVLRHYSYSDRVRYYWSSVPARQAVQRLFDHLTATTVPLPLISQYLPDLYPRVAAGGLAAEPGALVQEAVRDVLRVYGRACRAY